MMALSTGDDMLIRRDDRSRRKITIDQLQGTTPYRSGNVHVHYLIEHVVTSKAHQYCY